VTGPVSRLQHTHTQEFTMSNNKTGYELRAEMLHLAKDILSDKMHRPRSNGGPAELIPYTTDEVIAEATKLTKFVDTK